MEESTIPSVFDEIESEQLYFEHATPGQRFTNFIIDIDVYYICNFIVVFILATCMSYSGIEPEDIREIFSHKLITFPLAYIVYMLVYFLSEGISKGRTIGKVITRTCAVKEDISPITWNDAFIRTAIRVMPFEVFSAFNGSPWHDKWSKTYVIKQRRQF